MLKLTAISKSSCLLEMDDRREELILVRSLTESDLGIFASHRKAATSKQRAININADMARQMLSPGAFSLGDVALKCTCIFGEEEVRDVRRFKKTGKNWRLGGRKIEGPAFARLDSKDSARL